MRRVFLVLAVIAAVATTSPAGDLRRPPAPDDLIDPDLIELDLSAIVAEKEKLWSVTFGFGTSQQGLETSEEQARNIMTVKAGYDTLAKYFEEATGINIRWSKDSFEDIRPVLDIHVGARYKLPEAIHLPFLGSRLGVEVNGLRTGTATRFSDHGFGAEIADEAYLLTGKALVYLPTRFTLERFRPFKGVERREVYFGGGMGRAWAKHTVEIFMPDEGLQGIGDPYRFEATGSTNTYEMVFGLEEYFTPFLSVNLQAGYRWLEKGDLKYTDPEKVANSLILINEREVATVWSPWYPEGIPPVLIGETINWGWDRGVEPIVVDFSGLNFRGGLRYHF
jgi:hypothetical protein